MGCVCFYQHLGRWGWFTYFCTELTLALVCTGAVRDEVWLPDDSVQSRALRPPQPAHGLRAHQAAEGPRWGCDLSSGLFRLHVHAVYQHTWPPTWLNSPHLPASIHTSFNLIVWPRHLRASHCCCWEFYLLNVLKSHPLHGLFLPHFLWL